MTDLITENARLRAALAPFAMIADLIDDETEGISATDEFGLFFLNEDDDPVWFAERFSVQKFQEARAALATPAPDAPDLTDPTVIHANMLRGTIAKPTVAQIIHIYGSAVFLELLYKRGLCKPTVAPAPDVVQEAAMVPEIAALIEASKALHRDMLERAQLKIDTISGEQYRIVNSGRTAWADFDAALRAIAGDRT